MFMAPGLTLLESTDTAEYDAPLAEAHHSYTVQQGVQNKTPQDILINRTPKSQEPTSSKARAALAEMPRWQHAEAIGKARVLTDAQNLNKVRVRYKLVVNLKLMHTWICYSNFNKQN
jgi:hypothetical protein